MGPERLAFALLKNSKDIAGFVQSLQNFSRFNVTQLGNTAEAVAGMIRALFAVAGSNAAKQTALRQALSNLLNNAVKFTERGEVSVRAVVADGRLRVDITDTGMGIQPAHLELIFRPFQQVDTGMTRNHEGTGLGLASVYGIVKNHGGFINCDSEVGRGTTFKIYLPASDQAEANNKPTIISSQPSRGMETILLVDDEEFIRDIASKGLERFGYTVMRAASGEAALELFSNKPDDIDLVIMDIGMPGMGGAMCLQEIIRRSPSAKVLMASGYSNSEQVTQTLSMGASGYIRKPYQLNELLNKVRNVLDELK